MPNSKAARAAALQELAEADRKKAAPKPAAPVKKAVKKT